MPISPGWNHCPRRSPIRRDRPASLRARLRGCGRRCDVGGERGGRRSTARSGTPRRARRRGVAAFVLEHGRLWSVGVRGYAMIPDGLPLDEGVIGRAVRTSTAQLVLDVTDDPDFVEVSRATVSELSVPLVMPTGVVGVLNIETSVPLPAGVRSRDRRSPRGAGRPDGRAARLANGSLVARATLRLHELAPRPARDRRGRGALARPRAARRDEPAAPARRGRAAGRVDRVERDARRHPSRCRSRRSRLCGSASTHRPCSSCSTRPRSRCPSSPACKLRSVVLIPLRANGEEIGLLVGASRFAREFDRGQGELASLLAAHAAVSLDAAVALDRERAQRAHRSADGSLQPAWARGSARPRARWRPGGAERAEPRRSRLRRLQGRQRPGRSRVRRRAVARGGGGAEAHVPAGRSGSTARRRRVRRHASRRRCGCRVRGDRQAPARARRGPRRGRLSAAAERRGLDLPVRRCRGDAAPPRGRPGALPREGARQEPGRRIPGDPARRVARRISPPRAAIAAAAARARTCRRSSGRWMRLLRSGPRSRSARCSSGSARRSHSSSARRPRNISKVEGPRLADMTKHALRDIDLGEDFAYLIADYPVTQEVLETAIGAVGLVPRRRDRQRRGVRVARVADERRDARPAHRPRLLMGSRRDLRHASAPVHAEDEALARFLVGQAGRRIESIGEPSSPRRRLRFR